MIEIYSVKYFSIQHCSKSNFTSLEDKDMLWEISEENWKSVKRGIEKTRVKFLIASAFVISPEQPWYTYNIIFISLSMSIMSFAVFIGAVTIYYARNDLMTLVETAHAYCFIAALWAIMILQYTTKIPTMYQLLQILDTDIFRYKTVYDRENDDRIKLKGKKYALFFQKLFFTVLGIGTFILIAVTPLLLHIIGDGDRVKIEGINYRLPAPFWYPFNTDNRIGFILAYLHMSLETCVVLFFVAVGLSFIVYCAFEVGVQFQILYDSIINIEFRAIERYRSLEYNREVQSDDVEILKEDPSFHLCIRECLKENIVHHIEIVRFFNLLQIVTSPILGIVIGMSMVFLATMSFVLTKINLISFEAVKFTFFLAVELSAVFGYCFMGTSLSEASTVISKALYNCPWLKLMRKEEKKVLLIFEKNSAKGLVLKGVGLFVIDLQLFLQIVRTTYSIFNIVSSSEK